MNRTKSVFIGFYPMIAMGIIGFSGWQLFESRDVLTWAGPLLTTVPFVVFLTRIMMLKNVARTSARFPVMNGIALVGVALSVYSTFIQGVGMVLPVALAVLGAVTFFAYSVWYSVLGRVSSVKLTVGQRLPDFEVKDTNGGVVRTRDFLGKPALIFFYRGNWCPLCMAQVKEIAARYHEIITLGTRVVLISPQPHDNTVKLAGRFGVNFDFLTDEGNRAARVLNIAMPNGLPMGMGLLGYDSETVFPTVIILDADGVIRWVDQTDNYRIRPEPDTFLPLLRQITRPT